MNQPILPTSKPLFKITAGASPIHVLELMLPDNLDSLAIDELIKQILAGVSQPGGGRWIIDLTKVIYMGSAMLGLLVNIRQHIRRAGGKLALCGLSPQLLGIFQSCCLERLFTIVKTRGQAEAVLR